MKKIKNPWLHKNEYHCFGCCPDNPLGLKMEFYEEGDEIISYWHPNEHYQGWVGVMHGGILSTIIDEIAGWVVLRKMQTTGVTKDIRPSGTGESPLANLTDWLEVTRAGGVKGRRETDFFRVHRSHRFGENFRKDKHHESEQTRCNRHTGIAI